MDLNLGGITSLEVRALAKATEVLRQAQDIRAGAPKAVIVLSMVGKNYRLTKDMKDAAAALNLPLAETAMTLRQIYADAPGQAAVVGQLGSRASEAAAEVERLFQEILPDAHRPQHASPVPQCRDSFPRSGWGRDFRQRQLRLPVRIFQMIRFHERQPVAVEHEPCGIDLLFPPETHVPQAFDFPAGIVNDHRRLTPWHLEPSAPRRQSLRCRNAGIRPVNRETPLCGDLVRRNRNDLALIRHFCPL